MQSKTFGLRSDLTGAMQKKKLNQELSIMEVFRRNVWNLGLYWAQKERNVVVVVVLQLRAMN